MDPRAGLLSWIELDADAFAHNLASFRGLLTPSTRLLLVVKANAYGHGLPQITRLAQTHGVDALGVHSLEEAAEARRRGWKDRLLVMGYTARSRLRELLALEAEVTVFDRETLAELESLGAERNQPVACHLKVDTGTHRLGVFSEQIAETLDLFRQARWLRLVGVSTHFANIEDTTDHSFARGQLDRFREMSALIREGGFAGVELHAACTAALLTMPETRLEMVRLGIGAYGLWPSRETQVSTRIEGQGRFRLRPVLTWKARIGQLKWVPAGAYVGYGCTHRTSHRTHLAVLPVGYADGYDRGLSGLAHVLIGEQRAPILGRVMMNMVLVDVTDLPAVRVEDPVILLGRQGSEEIGADRLATLAQTIPYEIVSRLSPALPRFVVDSHGIPDA